LNNDDLTEIQGFNQPDFNLGDQFGYELLVANNVGCSSAPFNDRDGVSNAGMFYIYYFIPNTRISLG